MKRKGEFNSRIVLVKGDNNFIIFIFTCGGVRKAHLDADCLDCAGVCVCVYSIDSEVKSSRKKRQECVSKE